MDDREALSRTMWGEARGEKGLGMQAVGNVVMNRLAVSEAHNGYWWGNTVAEICTHPFQFSCWNKNDPNLAKLEAVTVSDPSFLKAFQISPLIIDGKLPDLTNGATHYVAAGTSTPWTKNQKPVATIGHHIFYRLV